MAMTAWGYSIRRFFSTAFVSILVCLMAGYRWSSSNSSSLYPHACRFASNRSLNSLILHNRSECSIFAGRRPQGVCLLLSPEKNLRQGTNWAGEDEEDKKGHWNR